MSNEYYLSTKRKLRKEERKLVKLQELFQNEPSKLNFLEFELCVNSIKKYRDIMTTIELEELQLLKQNVSRETL